MMRTPFTADTRPPIEPPASLDPETARLWADIAEQWQPDDDTRDHILLGMLARADQSTIAPAIRRPLVAEAERVLTEHWPDEDSECATCRRSGDTSIPFPCWSVRLARLVTAHPDPGTDSTVDDRDAPPLDRIADHAAEQASVTSSN